MKALERRSVPRQVGRKELQCHETPKLSIFRLVHHTHTTTAKFLDDAVVLDCLARPDRIRRLIRSGLLHQGSGDSMKSRRFEEILVVFLIVDKEGLDFLE